MTKYINNKICGHKSIDKIYAKVELYISGSLSVFTQSKQYQKLRSESTHIENLKDELNMSQNVNFYEQTVRPKTPSIN